MKKRKSRKVDAPITRPLFEHMRRAMDRSSRAPVVRELARRLKNAAHRARGTCARASKNKGEEVWAQLRREAIDRAMMFELAAGSPPGLLADRACDILILLILSSSIKDRVHTVPAEIIEGKPATKASYRLRRSKPAHTESTL